MSTPVPILISRCGSCHGRFLPREGPCPRCGSTSVTPHPLPPFGLVVASVELLQPAAPWHAPHRLGLVELDEGVRILVLWSSGLPAIGDRVAIHRDGDRYTAQPA